MISIHCRRWLTLFFITNLVACRNPPPKSPPLDVPVVFIPAWAVKITPIPGAMTRAEYEESALEAHRLDAAGFAANLSRVLNAVERFVTTSGDFEDYVNNWEVRGADLVGLLMRTIERMDAESETKPVFHLTEDIMGYPRLYAVWQGRDRFRYVRINQNNDNDSLAWVVAPGQFKLPDSQTLKVSLSREQFLAHVSKEIPDGNTVYPFIEHYSVCLPTCD
jgi:hypothetical protein